MGYSAVREKYIKRKYANREFVRPYSGGAIVEVPTLLEAFPLASLSADPPPTPLARDYEQDFMGAVESGDLHQLLLLLAQGASPNCGNPPALLAAARLNDATLLEFLIQVCFHLPIAVAVI
jgi:hypothetical protein